MKEKIRIGCGAGFSGDRLEPAEILLEKGNLDYLVLECLAERTIALAQKRKMAHPDLGYDPLLVRRMQSLLPLLSQTQTRLITNMGAAHPLAAAKKTREIAKELGLSIKISAVTGDSCLEHFDSFEPFAHERYQNIANERFISANAYMGIEPILEALQSESQIIITGRVADPSLFLAPMIHEFGWALDDFQVLGQGTVIGHLLECAGQITGGYFADTLSKNIPNLDQLGHPLAEISANGTAIIAKVEGTGGAITLATVKEQLLYEVINPFEYITPDVTANFTTVKFEQVADNQVKVWGGTGIEKPKKHKVSLGYRSHWQGEGEISYAGPDALGRAKLAAEIIEKRIGDSVAELKIDFWGKDDEVRLRIAAKCPSESLANLIGEEVEALYTNGPAGGGGVRKYTSEILGIVSALIDRELINYEVHEIN